MLVEVFVAKTSWFVQHILLFTVAFCRPF